MIGFTDILSAGVVSLALLAPASATGTYGEAWDAPLDQLESARLPQGQQRLEFLEDGANPFKFSFAEVGNKIDNEAVLQLQVGRGANTFLATLAPKGLTQFVTVLKPCGILLPHVHQRSNEFYSIIFGTMNAGISQENGGAQDIVFDVDPGEVFVVPQGLLHFNHNQQCEPLAFFQSFDSNDPGALNVIGALAALGGANDNGAAAIAASNASEVKASPQGAFALDQQCLKRCHLPESGAPGDGLDGLPHDLLALFGL